MGIPRLDIKENLPHGAVKEIAHRCGCSLGQVSKILNGRAPWAELSKKVLYEAQAIAAMYIWNTEFNKTQPTIDPLNFRTYENTKNS